MRSFSLLALALALVASPAIAEDTPPGTLTIPHATFWVSVGWDVTKASSPADNQVDVVLDNEDLNATAMVSVSIIDPKDEARRPVGVCSDFRDVITKKQAQLQTAWTLPAGRACLLSGITAKGRRFLVRSSYLLGRDNEVVTVRLQYPLGVKPADMMKEAAEIAASTTIP